jgi:hypothetical protein
MMPPRHHANPVMTYEKGTAALREMLNGCRPKALDGFTVEQLCRFHKVKPDVAHDMLLEVRVRRSGEPR